MTDTPLYQIVDYSQRFENAKARNIVQCSWFKKDSDLGNVRLSNLLSKGDPGGLAWAVLDLMLMLVVRQPKPRRGILTHDGKAQGQRYSLSELAMLFYMTEEVVSRSIDLLCRLDIAYLRLIENPQILAEEPTGDRSIPRQEPTGDRSIPRQEPTGDRSIPIKKEGKKERITL